MSETQWNVEPETLRRLVLARLMIKLKKPESRPDVVKAVAAAVSPPLPDARASHLAALAMAECERAGYVASSTAGRPGLTPAGEQRAVEVLGVKALPVNRGWQKGKYLVARSASGQPPSAASRYDADSLSVLILAARHGLPASANTPTRAVDRLAWRALGVDTDAPFTASAVQRYLLREIVPADTRVKRDIWRRMLAMRTAGASGHDAQALTRALLCRQSAGSDAESTAAAPTSVAAATPPSAANTNRDERRPQPSLDDFARAVREAAKHPSVTRFHQDRAFIGSVWEHMRESSAIGDMSLDEFKDKLITAHRQRLLVMTRADLVAAMDPREVERSEARYQNSTFHFVTLDAGGMR